MLLAMLGIISSAGCANYAYASKEGFYWLPAALNLAAYVAVVVKRLKRDLGAE